MGYKSFEELEVWKRACRLAVPVHKCKNVKRGALRDLIRDVGQIRFSFAVHAPHGRPQGVHEKARFLADECCATGLVASLRLRVREKTSGRRYMSYAT